MNHMSHISEAGSGHQNLNSLNRSTNALEKFLSYRKKLCKFHQYCLAALGHYPASSLIGGRSMTLDAALALLCSSVSISGNLGI